MINGVVIPGTSEDVISCLINEGLSITDIAKAIKRNIRAIRELAHGKKPTREEDADLVCYYTFIQYKKQLG
jgi:hypothetical protein